MRSEGSAGLDEKGAGEGVGGGGGGRRGERVDPLTSHYSARADVLGGGLPKDGRLWTEAE